MSEGSPVLLVEGLCAGYGRVEVLRDVNVHVARGELVTIIGSNGAGKSTLLKALVGIVPVRSGKVTYDGRDTTRTTPETAVRAGLTLVPEGRLLFGPMSVAENLELGAYSLARSASTEDLTRRVFDLFPILAERAGQSAATLSGGEQQMLAIGRALMSDPRVLLLDEPSLGLAPKVIAEIFAVLDSLKEQGMTIVLVEQDARLALRHADRGYVMRTGEIAMEGPAAELLADENVRHIYLGGAPVSVPREG
jgi:branched-chain amino acid transport system ATP-binding protein